MTTSAALELIDPQLTSASSPALEIVESLTTSAPIEEKISKQAIRTSLKASTLDGVFAAIFLNITTGVLLTNFLLKLGATPVEIGLLSSIPLLVNFLQPLGAYIGDSLKTRHWYTLGIYGTARLLWLILVAIMWFGWSDTNPHQLVTWTLGIMLVSNILGALGCSAWYSWMAVLVPRRLRGRYFGVRCGATSLTNLISMPLLGLAISILPGDTIENYSLLLFFAVVVGIISVTCQFWMTDVNPQANLLATALPRQSENTYTQPQKVSILKDINYLKFLLYIGLWTFGMNLSLPFFNLYMLNNLALNLNQVTVYTSLLAGANLVMLMLWGKLADKVGNRPLLLLVGIVMGIAPIFWLFVGSDSSSVWLWIPLIHIIYGGFGAALELCNTNIQMSIAPKVSSSQYFALAAAATGVCGGLGSTVGGFLAQMDIIGGLPGLFVISAVVRLIALLPLVFVQEPRSQRVIELVRRIPRFKLRAALVSP
jgi:MFS family permease